MRQNRDAIAVVPTEWHRLRACWADDLSSAGHRELALAPVGDGPGFLLAPEGAWELPDGGREASWIPFALRSAHPPDAGISPDDAPFMLVVRVFASDEDRDEFRRWLDEEHARLQVSLSGVNWYLGYEQSDGGHSFLNLWSVDDPDIVDSEAWIRTRDTPWWARLSHVLASADRRVFRRRG